MSIYFSESMNIYMTTFPKLFKIYIFIQFVVCFFYFYFVLIKLSKATFNWFFISLIIWSINCEHFSERIKENHDSFPKLFTFSWNVWSVFVLFVYFHPFRPSKIGWWKWQKTINLGMFSDYDKTPSRSPHTQTTIFNLTG